MMVYWAVVVAAKMEGLWLNQQNLLLVQWAEGKGGIQSDLPYFGIEYCGG